MNIAYLSHVDSRWIMQRPQFLAEALSDATTTVTYVCSLFVRRKSLVHRQVLNIRTLRVPMLPQRMRSRLRRFEFVAGLISAAVIFLSAKPEVILVTHARHLHVSRFLRKWGVRVYYDCMDLNAQFDDALSADLQSETELVRICDAVFYSSMKIREHILRLVPGARTVSVPNALDPESFPREIVDATIEGGTVGYMGTISNWFDLDAIESLLSADPKVVVVLCGPVDVILPVHDRIRTLGVLTHSDAILAISRCEVLVLPFLLTELVAAVDPVKLYEYIATGRPVIATHYEQLDHFGGFIHRYSTSAEFVRLATSLSRSHNLDENMRSFFVAENSWSRRASTIRSELLSC